MTGQPIDRIHFLEEQRRNRRRSLRFSVFALVAVALSGIPLCVIVAPLLFGPLLVVAHAIDLVSPLPEPVWSWMRDIVFALSDIWARLRGRPVDIAWGTLALVYVVPGAVLMVLSWPVVAVLTRRAGAATMLQRLVSRDIDTAAPAERQLANIVEEIAIAAGVRPPRVRIIESPAVNAVAVGLTSEDAVILATTGFLERLDRDERQAVIAHLIGSVGNGDLEIGATILSVFATWGLVALLLETPFNPKRWAALGRFLRLGVDAWRGRADPEQSRAMIDLLLGGAAYDHDAMIDSIMEVEPRSVLHGCVIMVVHVPLLALLGLASITAKMSIALFTNLGLGPWLAAMWRARRRLADASAVQLTRNPTALARAVRTLDKCDVEVPGGWVAYFLFPVWPGISEENAGHAETASFIVGMRLEADARLERIAALGAALESPVVQPTLRVRLARLGTWKDIRVAIGLGIVAVAMAVVLIAITLAVASLVLMLVWHVLRWLNPRR